MINMCLAKHELITAGKATIQWVRQAKNISVATR